MKQLVRIGRHCEWIAIVNETLPTKLRLPLNMLISCHVHMVGNAHCDHLLRSCNNYCAKDKTQNTCNIYSEALTFSVLYLAAIAGIVIICWEAATTTVQRIKHKIPAIYIQKPWHLVYCILQLLLASLLYSVLAYCTLWVALFFFFPDFF